MACPVTCQRRSASTIMSGMAIPMTANTMWKARDTPICERAASKSGIGSKIATVRDGGGRWRLWRLVEVTHEPTSTILHNLRVLRYLSSDNRYSWRFAAYCSHVKQLAKTPG